MFRVPLSGFIPENNNCFESKMHQSSYLGPQGFKMTSGNGSEAPRAGEAYSTKLKYAPSPNKTMSKRKCVSLKS